MHAVAPHRIGRDFALRGRHQQACPAQARQREQAGGSRPRVSADGAGPQHRDDLLGVVLYIYLEVIQTVAPTTFDGRAFARQSMAIEMKVKLSAVGSSA